MLKNAHLLADFPIFIIVENLMKIWIIHVKNIAQGRNFILYYQNKDLLYNPLNELLS